MEGRTWYVSTDSNENVPFSEQDSIIEEIHKVKDGASEFFVVASDSESDVEYVQAAVWSKGIILGRSFIAEVRLPSSDGFRHWRLRTKDFDLVEEMVLAYMEGRDPIATGKWDDVTFEFR